MSALEASAKGTRMHLHVVPRASRSAISGLHDGRVKLAITAPPVDGEANDAIVRFLARALGLTRDEVTLVSGQTGKRKCVDIAGLSPEDVAAALNLPTEALPF